MEDKFPELREIGRDEFQELVDSIHSVMKSRPRLDYESLYSELRNATYLEIPIPEDPSLDQLAEAVIKVQIAKDRISQILLDADIHCKRMKHYSKALYTAWIRLSGESSQDRRESDAVTRTWDFAGEAVEAEALYSAARSVLDNLKDKWDTISRSVYVIELKLKLGEFGGRNPTDKFKSNDSGDSIEVEGINDWEKM